MQNGKKVQAKANLEKREETTGKKRHQNNQLERASKKIMEEQAKRQMGKKHAKKRANKKDQ